MCTQHPQRLEKDVGSWGIPEALEEHLVTAENFMECILIMLISSSSFITTLSVITSLSPRHRVFFCLFCLFVFSHQIHFVLLNYSREWGPPWCVIHLPGIMSLKKADCHSPRSYQIPVTPQVKMVFSIAMKSKLEQFLFESKGFFFLITTL